MSGWFQYFKDSVGIVGALCGISVFISAAAGILSGFPIQGIIVASIIAVAGISCLVRRKPQVCGTYSVDGKNHINGKKYKGELQIEERGELLSGTWKFGTAREGVASKQSIGTGLRVGDALAFTFKYNDVEKGTEKGTRPGVSLYKIRGNDMSGKWAVEGETNAGFEECSKERA